MNQLGKEKILIVSPIVPRPDMNSGDLRLCSLIGILAKKYEITLVSNDYRPGDDVYVSLLERVGVTVYAGGRFSLLNLLKNDQFKVAILEFYFMAEFYLDRIRILQPECRVVIDTVDVHYLRLKQKYDLTGTDADQSVYRATRKRELCVYCKADAVITVTKDDATALLEEAPDITCVVVPNIHDICPGTTARDKNTLIFVGGFSHEPNVDAVLYFCRDILPLVRADKPDVHLTVIGSNPPDEILDLENEAVTVTGYVPETTPYLHRSSVSVAPLRYGAGMKGKIGEAMAHGVPVVTTSVGAQGMGLDDRKNIMIADSPGGFASAVLELLNDSCLHEDIRTNAIQFITDNYTTAYAAIAMSAALDKTCQKSAKIMTIHEKLGFFHSYIMQKIKAWQFAG